MEHHSTEEKPSHHQHAPVLFDERSNHRGLEYPSQGALFAFPPANLYVHFSYSPTKLVLVMLMVNVCLVCLSVGGPGYCALHEGN
jgi:hypothetical protein